MTRGRVLIVEDEPDLAWVEQFNLETEGYEVKWAAEGRAAIEALEAYVIGRSLGDGDGLGLGDGLLRLPRVRSRRLHRLIEQLAPSVLPKS